MSGNPFAEAAGQALLGRRHAEALHLARLGLSLQPEDEELLEIAALGAEGTGQEALAADYWRRLLVSHPERSDAANQLGLILENLGHSSAAAALFRQALARTPDDAHLHSNLGLSLESQGRLEEALACQEQALALAPASAAIRANLANVLTGLGRWEAAEAHYRQALAADPGHAASHSNLGVLLHDQGRSAEAEQHFRAALALEPASPAYALNLGQMLLARGHFAEGWRLHEARLQAPRNLELLQRHCGPLACPRWQGEDLQGKTILVLPEQGLGDEIQFCRYLSWLKARGPAQLIQMCRPELLPLMQGLAGPDLCLPVAPASGPLPRADYWTVLLSLPLQAGTTLENIPAPIPYLAPEPERQARLAPLVRQAAPSALKVGLVWRGNPGHSNDADRSLDSLERLAPLGAIPGLHFFSLQKGEAQGRSIPALPWTDLAPQLQDFADTAALLAELDLLISVDTSTAHLAGALGRPCWLLLPRHKTDWRWLQDRNDSPWYPRTRLYRQPSRGDWDTPLTALARDLAQLAAPHAQAG